jgi:very-short-patch-repair endonuclease
MADRGWRAGCGARRLKWSSCSAALGTSGLPWKFRRQHPIGCHIADFACPARKLAIELDGGQHAPASRADNDRSAKIEAAGYRVLRFWNNEVLENLNGVLEALRLTLEGRGGAGAARRCPT